MLFNFKVENFDENMRELGILLADRIYNALTKVKDTNELKRYESAMNDDLLESYKIQGYPEFIEEDYGWIINRIDRDKKGQFLQNCAWMHFALIQKYIHIRRGELPWRRDFCFVIWTLFYICVYNVLCFKMIWLSCCIFIKDTFFSCWYIFLFVINKTQL